MQRYSFVKLLWKNAQYFHRNAEGLGPASKCIKRCLLEIFEIFFEITILLNTIKQLVLWYFAQKEKITSLNLARYSFLIIWVCFFFTRKCRAIKQLFRCGTMIWLLPKRRLLNYTERKLYNHAKKKCVEITNKWISGNLVVKSKLPPRFGTGLEEVESYPQKGTIKFFFMYYSYSVKFSIWVFE